MPKLQRIKGNIFFEETSIRMTLQFCSIFTRFTLSSNLSCQSFWCHRQAQKQTTTNLYTGPPGRRVPWLRGMGRPRLRFSHLLRQYVPRRLKWSQEVGWKVGRYMDIQESKPAASRHNDLGFTCDVCIQKRLHTSELNSK